MTEAPIDDGDGSPRQSHNFAPGYYGLVCRAPAEDDNAASRISLPAQVQCSNYWATERTTSMNFVLQSMKWGLDPALSRRNPASSRSMKIINCRDDSLARVDGMWASIKKAKRCIVIAQGFFEWLKTGPKDRIPHYIKRQDDRLMCFAGLWTSEQSQGQATRREEDYLLQQRLD